MSSVNLCQNSLGWMSCAPSVIILSDECPARNLVSEIICIFRLEKSKIRLPAIDITDKLRRQSGCDSLRGKKKGTPTYLYVCTCTYLVCIFCYLFGKFFVIVCSTSNEYEFPARAYVLPLRVRIFGFSYLSHLRIVLLL